MHERFSTRRMIGDLGRMLKTHWASLLALMVLAVLAGLLVSRLEDALAPARDALASTGGALVQTRIVSLVVSNVATALFAGALLHVVLVGMNQRDRQALVAPLRAAVTNFPSVFLFRLLLALPAAASIVVTSLLATADAPLKELAAQALQANLATAFVSLVMMAFLAPALPAAVAEGLGPLAALRRGLNLSRARRLRLFIIFWLTSILGSAPYLAVLLIHVQYQFAHGGTAARPPEPVMLAMTVLSRTLDFLMAAAVYRELQRTSAHTAAGEPPPQAVTA